jgi:sugar phosphate isomerase/epimerase
LGVERTLVVARAVALDHLTVIGAKPLALVEAASRSGYSGVCLFQKSMAELPLMADYDLVSDKAERDATRRASIDLGVAIELVYPFSFGSRTLVQSFEPDLECAAELGARRVNALVYDRDISRAADNLSAFVTLASRLGLKTAVEFFPGSQVADLQGALALLERVDNPDWLGLNVDLLHLMRSGGTVTQIVGNLGTNIFIAQVSDGPLILEQSEIAFEASSNRLLPGYGEFDIAAFVARLPAECPICLEIPMTTTANASPDPSTKAAAALNAYWDCLSRSPN